MRGRDARSAESEQKPGQPLLNFEVAGQEVLIQQGATPQASDVGTLELAGCIVTLDALHCQKTTTREIHEADADYVLALKGNQGTAHPEIQAYLDDAILRGAPELVPLETVEKGHGSSDTALGYRFTTHSQLKLQYSRER